MRKVEKWVGLARAAQQMESTSEFRVVFQPTIPLPVPVMVVRGQRRVLSQGCPWAAVLAFGSRITIVKTIVEETKKEKEKEKVPESAELADEARKWLVPPQTVAPVRHEAPPAPRQSVRYDLD